MRLLILSEILLFAAAGSGAECTYFRVAYQFLNCQSAAPSSDSPAQAVAQDLPEFLEDASGSAVRVRCSCEYSLRGSDLRCEMDLTREVSQWIGSDDPAALCRRGKGLCATVCAKHLP